MPPTLVPPPNPEDPRTVSTIPPSPVPTHLDRYPSIAPDWVDRVANAAAVRAAALVQGNGLQEMKREILEMLAGIERALSEARQENDAARRANEAEWSIARTTAAQHGAAIEGLEKKVSRLEERVRQLETQAAE